MHHFFKNNPDPIITKATTYIEVVQKRTIELPDHVIYRFLENGIDESESLTYSELECKGKAVGATLQENGVKGDRVLMLFPAGLSYVASLFGCMYSGFVAVPAYPPRRNRGINRLLSIIADAEANLCLVTRQIYDDIERNFANEPLLQNMHWIISDEIDNQKASAFVPTEIYPEDIAFLQYTSGSTGQPKGVMITQLNLLYNCESIRRIFKLDSQSVGVHWLPVFHDMGLIGGILEFAYLGAVNIGIPPTSFLRTPLNWLKAIDKYRGTIGGGPNFSYNHCVNKISDLELANLDLSSAKVIYCGSEPIHKSTYQSFSNHFSKSNFSSTQFSSCYGMAETTLIVTGVHPETESIFIDIDPNELSQNRVKISTNENSIAIAGCGKTSMETIVKIVNPETFKPTASNEIGEIWIGGPTVAKGYWKKPEETQRTFNAYTTEGEGPFLRSGDLGFLYQKELFITGRIKDLIIIRGDNYYPSDIEYTVQKSHIALRENGNAAFSVIVNNQESLVVVQELERTAMRNTNFEEIISIIRTAVSEEHEIDTHAILLIKTGSIPMTSSGKIQRRQTRYEFLNNQLEVVARWEKENPETKTKVEKQTPTEDILQNWLINWVMKNQQFKREEIDLNTPITRYGIDSLAAVTLESEINAQFGFQWHVSSFMMNPTINELVEEGMEVYKEKMK